MKSAISTSAAASNKAVGMVTESEFKELWNSVAAEQLKIEAMMKEPLEEKGNDVWRVDNVVPTKLREILATELDAVANLPEKVFHPGSNNQVQDLIHPSLFPYIEKVSPVNPSTPLPKVSLISFWTRQYEDSKYHWLPSQFLVEENGFVKISSYINNLQKSQRNRDLYRVIELLFAIFLPMFEKILTPNKLRGRELQVIVKAANYVVQPQAEVYEGVWHVEGMSHEHILASGIYHYYETTPWLKDGGLEFRRARDGHEDYPQTSTYHSDMRDELGDDYPNTDGLQENIPLGSVPTKEERLIVFPNDLQHKVSGVKNDSPDLVGTRKILVFFLVDPDTEIVSTKHVPEQQWEWKVPGLVALMSCIAFRITQNHVPVAIVMEIVSRAKVGLTMAEARRHRLGLMHERKFKIDEDNRVWEREFSLCEH